MVQDVDVEKLQGDVSASRNGRNLQLVLQQTYAFHFLTFYLSELPHAGLHEGTASSAKLLTLRRSGIEI